MNNFDLKNFLTESRLLKEIDMSSKDGYKSFVDNEDILGTYSVKDAEEMARELAMDHFDYDDPRQNQFIKDFMDAYKEGGYMEDYIRENNTNNSIDMSSKDGYIAFIDNENIFGTYGLQDIEEMARELAMNHHDAGRDQDNFVKSFMAAYKEGGYMNDN